MHSKYSRPQYVWGRPCLCVRRGVAWVRGRAADHTAEGRRLELGDAGRTAPQKAPENDYKVVLPPVWITALPVRPQGPERGCCPLFFRPKLVFSRPSTPWILPCCVEQSVIVGVCIDRCMITAWCALNAAIRVQPFVLGGITVVELRPATSLPFSLPRLYLRPRFSSTTAVESCC